MAQVIRRFLLVEAATFITAAAIHGGWLISGYEHREARIAESIIAAVLLGGAAVAWAKPARTRAAGLFGQGFALFWTLVGVIMIAVGVGPRTGTDILYHIAIIAVLVWGIVVARSLPSTMLINIDARSA
jgi:hypothetical protein